MNLSNRRRVYPVSDAVPTLEASLADAEAIILLVNHTGLKELSPEKLKSITPARILIDTVNGWGGQDWESAGFTLHRLGVSEHRDNSKR